MIVKSGREKAEEVEIEVEKGKITRAKEYKYLGNWTEEVIPERQIEEVRKKMKGMVTEAIGISNQNNTGTMLLLFYEKTILPALTFNLEVWT